MTHPQQNAPLGKIFIGSRSHEKLRHFFTAQEVQPLVVVDVDFTEVTHVDEVLSPGPGGVTYVPDPAAALQLLRDNFPTLQDKLEGVLFSTDQERAKVTSVHATTFSPQWHHVISSLDYDTHQEAWQPYVGGYLRIVSNGASSGQVARIAGLSKATTADHPSANVAGKLKFEVDEVWNTAQTAPNKRASQHWNEQSGASQADWHAVPPQNAFLVCVKGSQFWRNNCPAVITVGEILDDIDFVEFNEVTLPPLIQGAASAIWAENPVGIPCLFYEAPSPSNPSGWKSVAFTPNSVNLQWVDGQPVLPLPFGPRNPQGIDVIRQFQKDQFPSSSPLFIDDWVEFHIYMGEIHCGSAAKRTPVGNWWLSQ